MDEPRIELLFSFFDHPNRTNPSRDRVFGVDGIAPCLPAAMGGGGGIIPYVMIEETNDEGEIRKLQAEQPS